MLTEDVDILRERARYYDAACAAQKEVVVAALKASQSAIALAEKRIEYYIPPVMPQEPELPFTPQSEKVEKSTGVLSLAVEIFIRVLDLLGM